MGAGRPPARREVVFWSRTLKKLLIWAQILVSLDCKTPWLDSHTGPRFQHHGGLEHICGMIIKGKWERDALRPGMRFFLEKSGTLKKLLIWAQILVSLECKTPWLDSHTGPRFQYHGGQNTFVA